MLHRRKLISGCLILVSMFAGTALLAADKPPIKIGGSLPLSGFQAPNGTMYRIGITMAIEDLNVAGGINGSKIDFLLDDDQGRADQAVLLFRRHVADGVVASLGPISGTTWESVAPLANSMKAPVLNFTALKPGISKKPYALRVHPTDEMMVPEGVAEFLKKYPKVKKVIVAGDLKEASGASGVHEFQKAAKANSLEIIDTVGFDTRTTDFSPIAIKIRGLAPDAIFLSAFPPNVLAILKELDTQGASPPVLVNALIWPGNFPQVVSAGAKNVYTIGFNTNESAPGIKGHDDFGARYAKLSGETTSLAKPANVANATLAYDAMMLLAGIMKEKKIDGSTDVGQARTAIMEGLAAVKSWQGLNRIEMRDSGDGYIRSRLLEIDPANKAWRYSLPQ
ncbi:MAG: ABC transporter substrate-binding protein [Pseudorhodoplanes sp.]|jgi:branched-chain amino acid transport system substrate-binding protein|nr:ABC transporter substrate-binding protein [Pseudorhodoplanes sp.]